jgi:hypothetical protein
VAQVKHAEDGSAKDLREIRPELFRVSNGILLVPRKGGTMDKDEEREVRNKVLREISDEMEPYKQPVPLSYRTFFVTIDHPRAPKLAIPCMGVQGLRNTFEWLRKFHPEWKIIYPNERKLEQILQEETPENLLQMLVMIGEEKDLIEALKVAKDKRAPSTVFHLDSCDREGMVGKPMTVRFPIEGKVYVVKVMREPTVT